MVIFLREKPPLKKIVGLLGLAVVKAQGNVPTQTC